MERTNKERFPALELIEAELRDEQPQTAAMLREQMRKMITQGGLRLDVARPTFEEVTGVREVDPSDPRRFVT